MKILVEQKPSVHQILLSLNLLQKPFVILVEFSRSLDQQLTSDLFSSGII